MYATETPLETLQYYALLNLAINIHKSDMKYLNNHILNIMTLYHKSKINNRPSLKQFI